MIIDWNKPQHTESYYTGTDYLSFNAGWALVPTEIDHVAYPIDFDRELLYNPFAMEN